MQPLHVSFNVSEYDDYSTASASECLLLTMCYTEPIKPVGIGKYVCFGIAYSILCLACYVFVHYYSLISLHSQLSW